MRQNLEGGDVGRGRQSLWDKQMQGVEKPDDEGGSEDDCEWSVDLEGEGGEEGERAQEGDSSSATTRVL